MEPARIATYKGLLGKGQTVYVAGYYVTKKKTILQKNAMAVRKISKTLSMVTPSGATELTEVTPHAHLQTLPLHTPLEAPEQGLLLSVIFICLI